MPADAVVRNYLHAKDENRPHLLEHVFTESATLEVVSGSTAIAFPAITVGRDPIAEVLVRSFNQTYENIYSFCLQRPLEPLPSFECEWLVVMTEKAAPRGLRVGCGRYVWDFDASVPNLARRLGITILEMQVLPASDAPRTFSGLEQLSYPWSSRAEVSALASSHSMFEFVSRQFAAR